MEVTSETTGFIKTVKTFSKESDHIKELSTLQRLSERFVRKSSIVEAIQEILVSLVQVCSYVFIILACLKALHNPQNMLTPGNVGAFVLFYNNIESYCNRTLTVLHKFMSLLYNLKDVNLFLMRRPGMQNGNVKLKNLQGDFEFKNVCFAYPSRPGRETNIL